MAKPKPFWKRMKVRFKDWFRHSLTNPQDRRRSLAYAKWVDLGFLRSVWINDGDIAPGVLRSNNPTSARFRAYQEAGLKTVVNLRNDTDLAPVKLAQETCAALGLTYVSYPMAPRRAPTRAELLGLLALFPTLQKPVLFHCKSGADRTGLVAAIWKLAMDGAPLTEARKELSLRYLHRRTSETGVLDAVLDQFEMAPDGMDFATWVTDHYDPAQAKAQMAALPRRGIWGNISSVLGDLYRYAQFREARWHKSFEGPIQTPTDEKRARFYMTWVDHGVLRRVWTNRAMVAPGVFRSNHPTDARFRAEAAAGIKTILNLRGAGLQPEYQVEKALCAELGVALIDIPMQATRPPTRQALAALFDAFDTAARPLLIHCKSGADRTGLVAALFLLDQGAAMTLARSQLSARFLHFKRGPKHVLDAVLDDFAAYQANGGASLRAWAGQHYDPDAILVRFRGKN